MRVLYLSQYYPPEVGATQERALAFVNGLAKAGHQVTVLTEVPNHPSGKVDPAFKGRLWRRFEQGSVVVYHLWVLASPKKTALRRIAFYVSYMLMAAAAGILLARKRYDVVYASSPPLFVGGAALAISSLRRLPLVFEVRDLWPEAAVALGELRGRRAIALASWLEWRCYRRARRIIVVTQGIRDRLVARGVLEHKLVLVPNGSDTELFRPRPALAQSLREKLGIAASDLVVLYAGNHGLVYGLEYVLAAAQQLQNECNLRFLFVGDGPQRPALLAASRSMKLDNVQFLGPKSREEMPAIFSMADIALAPLRNMALARAALPVKMFDAWACGTPTIITGDGEARRLLQEADAGLYANAEDAAALAAAICRLAGDESLRARQGANGRRFVNSYYTRQQQAQVVERVLAQVGASASG